MAANSDDEPSSPEEEQNNNEADASNAAAKTPSPPKRRKPRKPPTPHPPSQTHNNNNNNHPHNNNNVNQKQQQPQRSKSTLNQTTTTAAAASAPASFLIPPPLVAPPPPPTGPSPVELELLSRVKHLEQMVAKQSVELKRLKHECHDLNEAVAAFAHVMELLRQAGLQTNHEDDKGNQQASDDNSKEATSKTRSDSMTAAAASVSAAAANIVHESEIFGSAPSSLTHAADAAGAAILAGMLGGKQRMLVDVRDAELSRDPEILVQFIELAILPVAAGLEGLQSTRNRVKIVFPTVSQLLQYRRTMALAAPEVVALSTLGFDPVEKRDNLVVIVAPAPDDQEGLMAMNELFAPTDPTKKPVRQPVVVLNHHMLPVAGPAASFEVAYHLRLLNVQYMSSEIAPQYFPHLEEEMNMAADDDDEINDNIDNIGLINEEETTRGAPGKNCNGSTSPSAYRQTNVTDDAAMNDALEAAMKHAHEVGKNQGVTRAMVIRAFPRPWHVFVDTSPDTNADFVVAATFIDEPTQEEVNMAIVECLEGSEREDELVAQQMQQALESGQLDRVSELLQRLALTDDEEEDTAEEDEDDEDDLFGDFDRYEEDSV